MRNQVSTHLKLFFFFLLLLVLNSTNQSLKCSITRRVSRNFTDFLLLFIVTFLRVLKDIAMIITTLESNQYCWAIFIPHRETKSGNWKYPPTSVHPSVCLSMLWAWWIYSPSIFWCVATYRHKKGQCQELCCQVKIQDYHLHMYLWTGQPNHMRNYMLHSFKIA